jgi:hypothetical protein
LKVSMAKILIWAGLLQKENSPAATEYFKYYVD